MGEVLLSSAKKRRADIKSQSIRLIGSASDVALRKLRDPLERFMRHLIGAIERSARFRQSTHQCRP